MTRSRIFSTELYHEVEQRTVALLNASEDFLSLTTARSPRAVGDAVQEVLCERFAEVLGDLAAEYSSDFARRAMADLAFTDNDGCYHVVDVKTHRTDTRFNMPNLTSVERLARFYEDDANHFVLLLVRYQVDGRKMVVSRATFVPIEWLSWDCLTIGALGWGQIQIADAKRVTVVPGYSRRRWMLELCEALLEFYPREIEKIGKRIGYFEKVRATWEARPEEGG